VSKEDKCGLIGALLCLVLAVLDDWWRPFWVGSALILTVWTAASLWGKFRA
jgi:hypothetical protein